jgi:hypothetical protein
MDYTTQARNLVIGRSYFLSPELDINRVGGGFHEFARYLQNNSRILEVKDEYIPGRFKLFFRKQYPIDFTYPEPLRIDLGYIPPGITPLFIVDIDNAATKIQKLVRRKQAKTQTLHNLYAPGSSIGFSIARNNWNNALSGGTRKRRKSYRIRRSVKRQYSKVPSGIPRLRM